MSHPAPHPRFESRSRAMLKPKLERLANRLNTAYGLDLAQVLADKRTDDGTQCLIVGRGMSVSDVIAVVSIGHHLTRPTYNCAVFTMTAWFEYGDDPFASHAFYDSAAAACWVRHFIPSHPDQSFPQ